MGKYLTDRFKRAGSEIFTLGHSQCDLTRRESAERAFAEIRPEIVLHAAGFLGGIHFSRLYPADVFLKNLQIACHIFEMSNKFKVQKLVNIGSACVYSDRLEGPFKEEDMLALPMHPPCIRSWR